MTHTNYDTHHENFDFHIEQLGEFDRPFATLLDDLRPARPAGHARWWWSCRSSAERRRSTATTAAITGRRPGRWRWPAAASRAAPSSARPTPTAPPSPTARSTAAICSTPTSSALGLDPKKNHYIDQRPDPDGRPQGRRHHGGAGMTAARRARSAPPRSTAQTQLVAGAEAHQPAGRLPLRSRRASSSSPARRTTPFVRWELADRQEDGADRPQKLGARPGLRGEGEAAVQRRLGRPDAGLAGGRRRTRRRCAPSTAHTAGCAHWPSVPTARRWPSCGNDHLVKLWSVADGKLLSRTGAGHAGHVYNVAFHPGRQARWSPAT